jgi:nucleoside-diphosphate-sugar epimerase
MTAVPGDEADLNNPDAQNMNSTKYVLVTGGSGLVGSYVIRELLKEGRNVKALYRTNIPELPGKEEILWVKGDILDVLSLDEAMTDVEQVYHCAAIVSFDSKKQNEVFQTNIEGTVNVVNASLLAGVTKMCFVSSVAALDKNKKGTIISEQTTWSEDSNSSNYAKSKYLAEVEVWRGIAEGLQAVIVNPSIILGAGDWNAGSTKIFKTAYEEFPWYTEGITGFVDVEDVAKAMVQLMSSNVTNERFILNAENRPYKEVFTIAANAFNKKPPHKKVNRVLATVVRYLEAIKSKVTGQSPLLTKETAEAAQSIVRFDNSKLKQFLPSFTYTPVEKTIQRVCMELKQKNNLPL